MKLPAYPINSRYFYGTPWPVLIISSIALSLLLILCNNAIFKSASAWAVSSQKSSGSPDNKSTPPVTAALYAAGIGKVKPDKEINKKNANNVVVAPDSVKSTKSIHLSEPKEITLHKPSDKIMLSVFDKNFIKENEERNDSIIKLLPATTDMYSFHFKKKEIDPITDSMNTSRDSLLMLYVSGARKFNKIIILGFTDNTGSRLTNIKLGESRAEMVKDKLVKMGISPEKIVTASFGHKFPIDTNTTIEGRANNRRVEVNFQDS
jgi:outer membrane protein OmpA-like peptidoglycan-associated protein